MRKNKITKKTTDWKAFQKSTAIIILVIIALISITLAIFIFPLNKKDSFRIGKGNYDFYWISKSIKLGLDLEGGMYAVYEADLSQFANAEEKNNAMDGTISNLESLLFNEGYPEATVTKQGENQIRVEVPSIQDTDRLIELLGEPAILEFKDESGTVLVTGSKHLENASARIYEGQHIIALTFNTEGAKLFAEATEKNVGKTIGIYINGEKVMEPKVNVAITDGNAIISGNYNQQTAKDMATKINAGTFAVNLSPISAAPISPTLGQDAMKASIIAGVVGLACIILFLMLYYRGFGIAASSALIIYSIIYIYLLALIPWVQLTLPSIAGIILSIGMAVDANIIVFERIKEEKRLGGLGKGIPSSVAIGFRKGLPAIIDGNVTTILGAIVMIVFGAASIKGFGITLLIGNLLSMFSALVITRLIINCFLSLNNENETFYALSFKEVKNEKKKA
ncbi:MAG TPA: protein translocase subunit SecD [Clostridia bacterium]|nr:protein translocase subunit SecD [Clostridia bacterium]